MFTKVLTASVIIFLFGLYASGYSEELLVYSRLTDGYWQIWKYDLINGEKSQVTFSDMDKRNPVWNSSLKSIIFKSTNRDLYSIGFSKKKETPFLEALKDVGTPVFSSDGDLLLVAKFRSNPNDDADIWKMGVDGSNPLLIIGGKGLQYNPVWSPEDKSIVYVSREARGIHNIWKLDLTGKKTKLTNTESYNISPSFSPDGALIAHCSNVDGKYHVWIMDSSGDQPRRLTKSSNMEMEPCWSKERGKIYYSSFVDGKWEIWCHDLESKKSRCVISENTDCQSPIIVCH